MTVTANPNGASLAQRVSARRGADVARRSRALYWGDLLSSLWAPVTVFALAFVPYIVLIELLPASAAWAQPALKAFGLGMMVCFAALLVLRWVRPRQERLRRLRREARELLAEVDRRLRRRGGGLQEDALQRLEDQAARLDAAVVEGEAGRLEEELRGLGERVEKDLPGFRRSSAWDFLGGFAKALLIALVIRTVLIEPYRIPSGSMLPTLFIGDQVFINKFIYGVRIPFLNLVPFVLVREPERGDVVVFENPVTGEDYIKRVIGRPGDVVALRRGVTYLNGEPVPRELMDRDFGVMNRDTGSGEWSAQDAVAFREQLGARTFVTLQSSPEARCEQEGPWVVPEGNVFVMGDNRDNSSDSRYGLGRGYPTCAPRHVAFVPFGHIKGKAMVIWLSLGHGGILRGPFTSGLRTDRLFLPVR